MQMTVLGVILIIASGLMYTFERVAALLAWSLIWIGYHGTVRRSGPQMPGIGDNGFILLFFVAGLVMILIGLVRGRELGVNRISK